MATRMLALVALAEFLGMTLWFSATAATPALVAEFHLTTAETAWLTMAVQAGFVAGTLASALLNLPDVLNARLLFALGCLAGALANAGVAWIREPAEAIVLRFVTGAALACVYPPGMKIAAGWFERRRGTAPGVVVGALTIGSAFPHLLAWMAATVPWRTLMVAASALASLGGLLMWSVVRDGPYVAASAPFDPRAAARVFTERGTRLATLGYLGHMLGAVRDVDLDRSVRHGQLREPGARRGHAHRLARRVRDDRQRRAPAAHSPLAIIAARAIRALPTRSAAVDGRQAPPDERAHGERAQRRTGHEHDERPLPPRQRRSPRQQPSVGRLLQGRRAPTLWPLTCPEAGRPA